MTIREAQPGAECIHGLDLAVCDICTPRSVPEPVRRAPVHSAGPRTPRGASGRPASGPGIQVQRTEQRVFLVVAVGRLADVLSALPEQEWRSDLGSATDRFRWPDASEVDRPSELVVLVATAASGDLQFVAAANEPARRAVREHLDAAGVEVRVLLQPDWWS